MATPPDFTAGQVLTAAQMNAVGLWLVKSQTIGSAVSSISVTDAFSADYDNYRIIVSGGVASTSTHISLRMGTTNAGYYWGTITTRYDTGATVNNNGNNVAQWDLPFYGTTDSLGGVADVLCPFLSKNTRLVQAVPENTTTSAGTRVGGGYLNNTTSYTSFTLTVGSGTVTGGIVAVYGYRK